MTPGRLRVLVLARSYPNPVLPTLGLWTQRPTSILAGRCDLTVVSPVPYCPPLPRRGPAAQYARFRDVPGVERIDGVPVLHPRLLVGPGSTLYRFEAGAFAASVRRALRRSDATGFDLVHAHFSYPDGAAAHRIASELAVPFVITEHAPWTGWMERPGVAREAVPAVAAAARVLAVSTSVRSTIHAYAPSVEVDVVPVGVDTEVFRPLDPGLRRPGTILFVGFLNYNKGVDVLLRAFASLAGRQPRARLLLAGGSFYRNTRVQELELRRLALDLGLGERVEFLGRLPPESVARLMAESTVVVLPSRAESFGAVLVEALACGTPVVATACGGPEDIVTDEVGRLVPVGDAEALANAIDDVLAQRRRYDPAELRRLAVARFRWSLVADRYLEAYERALAGHRRDVAVGVAATGR